MSAQAVEKHTLLIVEDDADTSEMLRVYFESQHYSVITARNGEQALDICQATPPDLILLDVRLPDIDGFSVGQRLQEDTRTSRVPVIFITERHERDDRITGLKLGAVGYVAKPFDVHELRLRVRNTLHRARNELSPVTGLPGQGPTTARLALMLEHDAWAAISVRIDGLERFNEIYGFVARDDALRAVALILTTAIDELGTIDDFVGQSTEGKFVIATVPLKAAQLEQHIRERLGQAMVYFYPIHDRQAGYVTRGGDDSRRENVPFLEAATIVISQQDELCSDVESLKRALMVA
jgi:PleD family two-component response regulator